MSASTTNPRKDEDQVSVSLPIFLDNHSTTRVDPRVLELMLPYFGEYYGNAASRSHSFGWTAEAAIDNAREQIAGLIGGSPNEIILTSGATEADNLAIKGATSAYAGRGDHIVTVATEHKAVLDSCRWLESQGGARATYLAPAADGLVTPEQVADAVGDATVLVSIMLVNNEIGVVQPIADIVRAVRAANPKTLVHCDAAQAAGRLPLDVRALGLDMASVSAHKLYGPKGVGALWVRRRPRVRLAALIHGGGHEGGLRSGTLPVPGIVGFGAACEIAAAEMTDEQERIAALRDRLRDGITSRLGGVSVNGSMERRVAGNLNLSFERVEGEALLLALRDIALSSGAACSSAALEPSYVLSALGVPRELAHSSIRFGVGRFNTGDEIDYTVGKVVDAVTRLRELHVDWPTGQEPTERGGSLVADR